MVWIVLEALLALAVLLGIVGWTMASRRPEAVPEPPASGSAPPDDSPPTPDRTNAGH